MQEVQYFSMFSGIGGFELGLKHAEGLTRKKFVCVGYSEIDRHAINTYEEHFDHDNYGDATTIDPATIPPFDLGVMGFPCQAFSIAGKRLGFEDTRGTLFFDVARILAYHKPRNFILENVKGLVSHDSGRTFRTIIQTLAEMGYCVEWKVCNTKDYGLPQNRERIYIVGHLGGIPDRPVFSPIGQSNPYTTVGLSAETAVARTLTAGGNSGGNHSGMTVLRTPVGDRRLSTTEWERLQGFPDGWTIGSESQRKKQCGNAASVPVVLDIATKLFTA